MLCLAAALFHKPGMTDMSDLGPIHAHLGTLVGGGAALAFGIALMASGLSSSSVGTYVGRIVMAGFMNWLHRVQIVGHYCTNLAAEPRGAPARQKIWPETPEQRVLTVSATWARCSGRSRVRIGCPEPPLVPGNALSSRTGQVLRSGPPHLVWRGRAGTRRFPEAVSVTPRCRP
jgi:hypothetical protein